MLATGQDKNGGPSAGGGNISIHDLLVDSVHAQDWKGQGVFGSLFSVTPQLHDVSFDHITAFVPGPIFQIKVKNGEKIPNFSVTNSVFMGGGKRREMAAAGRAIDCPSQTAVMAGPEAVLKECFNNYKFERNLIIAGRGGWPVGNLTVSSPEEAGIKDLRDGAAKDARLCGAKASGCSKRSPGASAASDGKDLGADVDAVEAATAGID